MTMSVHVFAFHVLSFAGSCVSAGNFQSVLRASVNIPILGDFFEWIMVLGSLYH